MEQLLQKAKINDSKIRRLIFSYTAKELSNLAEPCYYPSMKKYYFELLNAAGLKEKDIEEFVKRFYRGLSASKWKLQSDPKTNFYIFLMYYFLNKKDYIAFSSTLTLYNIRNYTNKMNSMMKFCNEKVFRYTLEKLVKNHLFSKQKSIAGGLYHLSKELQKRYDSGIREGDVEKIIKFITEARHRVSQSVKSFAETYYRIHEEGIGIKQKDEENDHQYDSLSDQKKVIDSIVKKITVYKHVDKKSLEDSKKLTKVKSSLAQTLASKLTNTKYTDNVKIVLDLFTKDLKRVSDICGSGYYKYVKLLMSVKRTAKLMYFKQQVNVLLTRLIEDNNLKNEYSKLSSQSQFFVASFLAYYITGLLRNSIC